MKTGNLTLVYGLLAVLSLLLLIAYLLWEKKQQRHFLFLLTCVAAVNCGYFLLAASDSLPMAMAANAISYWGAAYSLAAMLLILAEVCQCKPAPWCKGVLLAVSTAAFLLAAGGDRWGLYYRSVELVSVNGMAHLVKEYGPLHIVYRIYLLSYVALMLAMVWYARKTGRLTSLKYTSLLMVAVLLNVGVWAVEQAVEIDFEFLSVSYIVTAVFLLLLYGILRDYGIIQPGGQLVSVQMLTQLNTRQVNPGALPPVMENMFRSFAEKVQTLSPAERRILNYYIDGHEITDIPELAFISIHTVKKHNHSIYQKLAVSSRDELMLYIELFRSCDRLQELLDEPKIESC